LAKGQESGKRSHEDCKVPNQVGYRPPGDNVGDSRRLQRGGKTRDTCAEYRTQPPGGRLPTFPTLQSSWKRSSDSLVNWRKRRKIR